MNSTLEKIKERVNHEGLYKTLCYSIKKVTDGLYCFVYFLSHWNLSPDILAQMEDWKAYLLLRKQYNSFLDNLPLYTLKSTEKTKIIWWCWLQGEVKAPLLCQKCLNSLRRYFKDYEIKVVTENNYLQFVHLPDYILDKYHKGIISRTHFSDILRTCLLAEHGGIWIDSTVLCTGYREPIFDYPIFVFQDWKFNQKQPAVASNWMISAWKEHPIMLTMRDLLFEYWRTHDKLVNYFVFHLFFHMVTEKYNEEWSKLPRFSNIPPHLLQFELFNKFSDNRFKQLSRMSDFHKLTYKGMDKNDIAGTFYEHIIRSYL